MKFETSQVHVTVCFCIFIYSLFSDSVVSCDYQIHKLIVSIWNKEELPEEWKESIIVPIHKKGDKTD